jgi:hypothetical protein
MDNDASPAKRRPPWLVGLVIAVVVFVIMLIVANLLGYGDDPAVGASRVLPTLVWS